MPGLIRSRGTLEGVLRSVRGRGWVVQQEAFLLSPRFLHAPQAYTAPTIAECQCQVPTLALSGPQRHTAGATGVATHSSPAQCTGALGGRVGGLTFHPRCSCRTPRRGRTSRRNLSCPTYWHRTALWRHPGKEGGQGGEAEGSQGPARAVRVGSIFLSFCFSG